MIKITYKKSFIVNIILLIVLYIITVGSLLISFRSIQISNSEQLERELTDLKKLNLSVTVKNTIATIDYVRNYYTREAEILYAMFIDEADKILNTESDNFITKLKDLQSKEVYSSIIQLIVTDNSTRDKVNVEPKTSVSQFWHEYLVDDNQVIISIYEDWIYQQVVAQTRGIIYQQTFDKNEYIWVNEIVNWSGGDKYAIRRIHPNLRDTEGQWLSTETTDRLGGKPYKEELEGVKKDGSLFFYYYFIELNSDTISKKLSYAELYEPYNWIVAMGVYVTDLEEVMSVYKAESTSIFLLAISRLSPFLLLFFIIIGILYYININNFVARFQKEIQYEANHDPLTGILNRRLADLYLKGIFRDFNRNGKSPAIVMLDIDDFKKINDQWGHDIGDKVLQSLTKTIQSSLRTTDYLFRWGGEEFLLMYPNIEDDELESLGKRLNILISSIKIEFTHRDVPQSITITVSIGISKIRIVDSSPQDSIKRADIALYMAKDAGKNCTRINL